MCGGVGRRSFPIPTCGDEFAIVVVTITPPPDIDECEGVVCGGASTCTNAHNRFSCECADGWTGGGDDEICTREWVGEDEYFCAEGDYIFGHGFSGEWLCSNWKYRTELPLRFPDTTSCDHPLMLFLP